MPVSERICLLQYALSRVEACPRTSRCGFWEEGGAVLDEGCLLERILPSEDWTPELAARWLRVRRRVEQRRGGETQTLERDLFQLLRSSRYSLRATV